jgi:hypothetical protein
MALPPSAGAGALGADEPEQAVRRRRSVASWTVERVIPRKVSRRDGR